MATVNFRLRSKANKNVTIYVYLSMGRGSIISTKSGFTVNPKDWSETTNKPKQNTDINKQTFNSLNKLEGCIYGELNNANKEGRIIDLDWLKQTIDNCFDRVKKDDIGLLVNHIQYIIDNANTRKIKGSSKIGLSKRRIAGYGTFLGVISEYQKVIRKQIHLLDIDKTFVDKFINYLINKKNYSKNYAGKQVDNLKTVCLDAQGMGIDTNPFVGNIESFKENNDERFIVTLSFDEIRQIRNADIKNEALLNVRKWLLIGCEIGQRASDLLNITSDNIRHVKGGLFIDIVQQKTGKSVTVAVLDPLVVDLVENDFPYKISTQKLNKHLKTLCSDAEINQVIEGKKYDKETKRKKLGFYPKHQLVTSHSFRRSFATNYYKKIPTPILINITGHSKESMFLEYINRREDKDENANLFMQFYEQIHAKKEPVLKVVKNKIN
jgi:integrase